MKGAANRTTVTRGEIQSYTAPPPGGVTLIQTRVGPVETQLLRNRPKLSRAAEVELVEKGLQLRESFVMDYKLCLLQIQHLWKSGEKKGNVKRKPHEVSFKVCGKSCMGHVCLDLTGRQMELKGNQLVAAKDLRLGKSCTLQHKYIHAQPLRCYKQKY